MYQSKLVASLKANCKILREFKDTVYIPFGSEYSFLIKNLHTQRAVVNVFIDGEDVVEGGLVIDAGREVDLERYVKVSNLKAGNKFKFIERTSNIEQHRGVKLEDGLIRIEFQYEQSRPVIQPLWDASKIYGNVYASGGLTRGFGGVSGSTGDWAGPAGATYSTVSASGATLNSINVSAQAQSMPVNDVGITVPGSKSTQSFTQVTMGVMETEKHSIVLKLLGETPDNKPVLKPVTVFTKQKCQTCNKTNKAHSKFCVECGTSLEIFA